MPGAYSNISQPSPKRPTVFFGGGSYLGLPCRGGRDEREEEKQDRINIQETRDYLECGYKVDPDQVAAARIDGPATKVSVCRRGVNCHLPTW